MGSLASWVRSFGVSIAIHAIVAAVVLHRAARETTDQRLHALLPVRVVWVDPARAAPAVPAVPASAPAMPPSTVPQAASRGGAAVQRRREVPRRPAGRRTVRPAPLASAAPASEVESDVAAAATAPAASAPERVAAGGGDVGGVGAGDTPLTLAAVARPPEIVERVLPEYPVRARALELEGRVVLEVVLDREGRPEPAIRVIRSQPPFDEAALAAVRRWRFRPARDAAGHPVRVLMEIPVRFELR